MATFLEEYNSLDTVPQQKARSYQMLSDNRSRLQMTPDEEYKFNWGPEALSEDWINSKAKEIQANIENANSTSILRRGLGKGEEVRTPDKEAKEDAKSTGDIDPVTGKPRVESNHGNDASRSENSREPGMGLGYTEPGLSFGFDTKAAAAAPGGITPIGLIGKVAAGVVAGSHRTPPQIDLASQINEDTRRDNAVRDRVEAERVASLDAAQNALADDTNALNGMSGGGYGGGENGSMGGPGNSDGSRGGQNSDN